MILSTLFSNSIFLSFVAGIPLFAAIKKINVYDCFIDGAKQGVDIIIKIIPFLVAMIVAISMLRASGFFELLSSMLKPILTTLNIPADIIPVALLRPFSGSAGNGLLAEIIHHHGANSYIAKLAATMLGSTETTFYVVAVYFGVIAITRTRHAIVAGLLADTAGIIASIYICRWVFHPA